MAFILFAIQLLTTLIYPHKGMLQSDRHKSLTIRNISPLYCRPQQTLPLKNSNPLTDLKRLGKYINSNIQSQRRNVQSLYSTSYKVLQSNKRFLLPEIEISNNKKALKRKSNHSAMLESNLSTLLPQSLQSSCQNPDFVVSNNFPTSHCRTPIKKQASIKVIKWQGPKKMKQTLPKDENQEIYKPEIFHQKNVHNERIRLRKKKHKNLDHDELNPWEYLRVPDQVSFNQLP